MLKHKSEISENLVECLQEISIKNSSKGITFIQNDDEDFLSYREFYNIALMTLNELQKKNLKPGDELVLQIDDNKELLIIFWACLLGGIIPITTPIVTSDAHRTRLIGIWRILNNPHLITSKKVYEKLKHQTLSSLKEASDVDVESRIILSDVIYVNEKNGTIHETHPDDIAYIQFSSGSTGNPKGIILTHENLISNLGTLKEAFGLSNDDCMLGWMPLTHNFGLLFFHIMPLVLGCEQNIMTTNTFIKNPLQWMDKAHKHKATYLAGPNFAYKHFLSFLTDDEKEKRHWDLSNIRIIANGAEPISAELSKRFFNELSRWGLKNNIGVLGYGLTEATSIVTLTTIGKKMKYLTLHRDHMSIGQQVMEVNKDDECGITLVDVGHAFDCCKFKICDNEDNILPDNVVGEIYVKGKNVTRGYYNDLQATKRVMTQDGWLKTGDLGFKRDEELFVSGRKKEIIFVNGQNYYPHDIEAIASEIRGGEAGKVVVCGIYNPQLEKDDIVMFVLFEDDVEKFVSKAIEFKKYINLSTGLVLKHVLPINKIPKTITGKVRRFILKEAYSKGEYKELILHLDTLIKEKVESRDVDLATTKLEIQLVNIWSDILGINNIGINDNFFELGGNSLKIALLIKKIYESLNINLTMGVIFKFSTVKTLSAYLTGIKTNNLCETAATMQAEELEYYPLAAPQKRIYVLCKFNKNNFSYNTPIAFGIKGNVNINRLKAVLDKLVKRHEALRTGFVSIDNIPYQKIYDEINFNIEEIDAKGRAVEEIIEEFIRPFDLDKPPLFRVGLITLDVNDYILLFDMHHIIFDGQSARVLIDEVTKLYSGKKLDESVVQYKDYTMAMQNSKGKSIMKKQEKYWLEKLKDVPELDLPLDYSRPSEHSFIGDIVRFKIDKEVTKKLEILANDNKTTLYSVLFMAYMILLNKYTNQKDIVVGTPVLGRLNPIYYNTVGMFVNTLAIKSSVKEGMTINNYLLELKNNIQEALANQDYQFDELVQKLHIKRGLSRNPLFDTMFIWQNDGFGEININDLEIQSYQIDHKTAKFDLKLEGIKENDEIQLYLEYSVDLFKRSTAEGITKHYSNILKQIAFHSERKISDIQLITDAQKDRTVQDFNEIL